tara:strand:+ start:104 stop:478 length:375 start_codon:yes stop_codon:yes gene_type:complete
VLTVYSRGDSSPFAAFAQTKTFTSNIRCFASHNDGRFELENKQSQLASMASDYCDMGPYAVVRHGGLTLLLTSIRTAPFDLGQRHSRDGAVEKLNVVAVKAAVAHRAAYDPITGRIFKADTPEL